MTSSPPTDAAAAAANSPTGVSDKDSKRTSIAWTNLPAPSTENVRRTPSQTYTPRTSISNPSGSRPGSIRGSRSLSSPPPPPSFVQRVSFDTFDNKDATDFSLTLKAKHRDYQYTRRSRTFLCGTDQNDYSEFALEWLIDELVDDGDEIVCLRVVEKDNKLADASQERLYRQEAQKLLDQIIEKNEDEKAISIILEFSVGKVHETIQRMIHIYEPVILIVGTRGRSLGGLQGLLPGSVSKYCLQHSPVPVIVVRPSSKRDKKKAKRIADPNRRIYQGILEQSGHVIEHPGLSKSPTPAAQSSVSLGSSGDASPGGAAGGVSPGTVPDGPLSTSPAPSHNLDGSTLDGAGSDHIVSTSPADKLADIEPIPIDSKPVSG